MRVCFVCSEYPPGPHGGIGTMVQLLARALVAAGHEARVVGVHPASYPAPDVEVDRGVRIVRLRESGGRLGWIAGRRQLYRMVAGWSRSGEIDVVEVPDWEGWAAGWPRLTVPVVVRANGSLTYFAAELNTSVSRRARFIERRSLRRADGWCSVSRYTGERTRSVFGLPSGPSAVLFNALDPAALPAASAKRDAARVVFTGTLTAKKGVVELIDAWPSVVAQVPNAELHLYGKDARMEREPSMRAYLETRLPAAARASVHFHGHVTRDVIHAALSAARVAVFPSYSEACALAPIEALAAGCAVIHTRLSSGPEVIRDGIDGLLVDPRVPAEIGDALRRLLCDDALVRRLSAQGPETVRERFSLERTLPGNIAFYDACIASFRRRRAAQ